MLRALLAARKGMARSTDKCAAIAPPSVERALGAAVTRAAQSLYRLPVAVAEAKISVASLAEILELLPERPMIAVLEGLDEGLGVMAMSPGVVSAVIEFQTIGRVSARNDEARRATRTDALICAELVNASLAEALLIPPSDLGWSGHWRYATFLDEARPLGVMLDEVAYGLARLRLRLGASGQREGEIVIALPRQARITLASAAASTPVAKGAGAEKGNPDFTAGLHERLQEAKVTLDAVLCRKRISLRELYRLSPGAMLALPAGVLEQARLEMHGGRLVAQGKLGEAEGYHALRLSVPGAKPADGGSHRATQNDPSPVAEVKEDALPRSSGRNEHTNRPLGTDVPPDTSDPLPLAALNGPDSFRPQPTKEMLSFDTSGA